ncbi:MAG: AAA family ATPase [Proteobacteria bacterium]|nr:AAA family ATPase [Pseudomonadota bacterium]
MKPTTLGPVTAGIPKKLRRVSEPAISKVAVRRKPAPSQDFSFSLKPADIAKHLNRFVIGQNEAKKVLGVALCDHFQHVRLTLEGKEAPFYQKQNVLLLGPTGVGKTHLIRSAADLIGVPFVKADATKFSETGYVGGDVDDLVRDLIRRAGGDIKRASHGIIYLDEVDKLAGSSEGGGRDVSGRGVQTNLLKLMEDGDVPVLSPNDVTGQLQSAMSAARGNTPGMPDTISTRHILFIASGAFVGIDQIIRDRLTSPQLALEKAHAQISTADFIRFGLEPEFVGRLPVRVACHALDEDDLFHVLSRSESSLLHQYERSFAAYGISLRFQPEALRRLAALARDEKTGARGLMTVLERTFRDLKFRLPSTKIRSLNITPETVENPAAALKKLLSKSK